MRYLNIEVVLGLVALAQVAADVLHVQLPSLWYIVVPLATWAIYTLDRLLDSRADTGTPETGRHAFHARHRTLLLAGTWVALAISAVVAIAAFPLRYWGAALLLGVLTVSHRALQRSTARGWAVVKDVNVALTYTLAAWAIPLADAVASTLWSFSWLPAFLTIATLVMIDVILLSRIDAADDALHHRPSIAVALGDSSALRMATAMAAGTALTSVWWMAVSGEYVLGGSLLVMAMAYVLLARVRGSHPDRLRLYLESVLVIPLVARWLVAW